MQCTLVSFLKSRHQDYIVINIIRGVSGRLEPFGHVFQVAVFTVWYFVLTVKFKSRASLHRVSASPWPDHCACLLAWKWFLSKRRGRELHLPPHRPLCNMGGEFTVDDPAIRWLLIVVCNVWIWYFHVISNNVTVRLIALILLIINWSFLDLCDRLFFFLSIFSGASNILHVLNVFSNTTIRK